MNSPLEHHPMCKPIQAGLRRSGFAVSGWCALAVVLLVGCQSLPRLDPTGESLCLRSQPGAERLSTSRETDVIAASGQGESGCGDSPWREVSLSSPSGRPTGQENRLWATQRPNGAVLFPRNFTTPGPAIALEPKSMIAQVGSEVVMVASFVGEGNEHLKINEKLQWNLDGAGRFLTSNPVNGCLYGDISTQKISDTSLVTSTSNRLWRVHRGTATPTDDISILRGQSWATVVSYQEGTSAISILADRIDDWSKRSAGGQVHWVDAAFFYPNSGVSPVGEPTTLTTTVHRKTTQEPRPGWIVRYEILSGPSAGLGSGMEQTVEVQTDALGEAKMVLTGRDGTPGSNKIGIKIIRPAADGLERVVVDEKTILQSWSGDAIFSLQFSGPRSGLPGTTQIYQLDVTNRSGQPQDALVRVTIPSGTSITSATPQVSTTSNGLASWLLAAMPPRSTQVIRFDLNIQTSGTLNFDAQIDRSSAVAPSAPIAPIPPAAPVNTVQPPTNAIAPPLTTPSNSAPSSSAPRNPPPGDPAKLSQDTSSTTPRITPPTSSGSVKIHYDDPFPATVTAKQEFQAVFSVEKTGTPGDAYLSMIFPPGVFFLAKDASTGETTQRYDGQPLTLNTVTYGAKYPGWFVAENPGPITIEIRVIDVKTQNMLDFSKNNILVSSP